MLNLPVARKAKSYLVKVRQKEIVVVVVIIPKATHIFLQQLINVSAHQRRKIAHAILLPAPKELHYHRVSFVNYS